MLVSDATALQRPKHVLHRWSRQFSLSSLLIAITVLCGWLACHVNRVHREERAIRNLEEAGVYVTTASNAPEWVPGWLDRACFRYVIAVNCYWRHNEFGHLADPAVPLSRTDLYFLMQPYQGDRHDGRLVTNDLLADIRAFQFCKVLYLGTSPISDVGVSHLADLHHIQVLLLSGTNVTDAGLARLSKLKYLCHLALHSTRVTDRGVEAFRRALPDCYIAR